MQRSSRGEQLTVAIVFFLVGGVMALAGLVWRWSNQRSLRGREQATAIVTAVESRESGPEDSVKYFPTLQFTTAGGQFIEVTPARIRTGTTLGGLVTVDESDNGYDTRYEVGDEVGVYYDPAQPTDVILRDFNRLWTGPLVVGGLGLCFAPLGLLLGLWTLARQRR
jgi:hypothetical protein